MRLNEMLLGLAGNKSSYDILSNILFFMAVVEPEQKAACKNAAFFVSTHPIYNAHACVLHSVISVEKENHHAFLTSEKQNVSEIVVIFHIVTPTQGRKED